MGWWEGERAECVTGVVDRRLWSFPPGVGVVLYATVAEALESMRDCSRMGGDDKHGVEWSHHYDAETGKVLANVASVIGMIDSFAATSMLPGRITVMRMSPPDH